jgi:hypothetical protein
MDVVVLSAIGYGCLSLANHVSADSASCRNSAPTDIARTGGECVGVTDGSFIFPFASKQLQSLESLIASENQVGAGKDYVTVVYLQPAPNSESDNNTAETLQAFTDQLTGAYAEQHAYNAQVLREPGPQSFIHLLIASSGVNADQYQEVDGIIKAHEAADHIVAVAGLNVSLQYTVAEAKELAEGRTASRSSGAPSLLTNSITFTTWSGFRQATSRRSARCSVTLSPRSGKDS